MTCWCKTRIKTRSVDTGADGIRRFVEVRAEPVSLGIPELCVDCEKRAADLWRADNPTASVWDCDAATKSRYRAKVLEAHACT